MEFSKIAEYLDKIEQVSSRLEMTSILSELLKKADEKEIKKLIYLMQGKLGPNHAGIEAGIGEGLMIQGIAKAAGYPKEEVEKIYKETGDLGLVAEMLSEKKKQQSLFSEKLTIEKVFSNFIKISNLEGKGSQETKLKIFAELINSATPKEAKYIARVPLGNMRLGIGDPTIMDGLATNYIEEFVKNKKEKGKIEEMLKEKKEEEREKEFEMRAKHKVREIIEEKYNIHSDLGEIAEKLKKKGLKGLKEIEITPGTPIRPTLAERLSTAEEIIEKIPEPIVEQKYDGFRIALHKNNDDVKIYSRQSENVTKMFPELVEAAKEINQKSLICEGEAIAVKEETNEFLPFQVTIQRKRKYSVEEMAEEFPLKLFVFDLMFLNGENYMPKPLKERRKKLEQIFKGNKTIKPTNSIITADPEKIENFFLESIENGLEGIIAKDPEARYIAGARKFAWIKLKRSYKGELQDSVDVTIIGYFKGKGKRTKFGLGGLLTAVYDEKEDLFKSICKIGTGMSEQMLEELEGKLKEIAQEKKPARIESELKPDFWVKPKFVIEVVADEITISPLHSAGKIEGKGYALRFPRMIKFREKKPEESTTVKEIIKMYKQQSTKQTES